MPEFVVIPRLGGPDHPIIDSDSEENAAKEYADTVGREGVYDVFPVSSWKRVRAIKSSGWATELLTAGSSTSTGGLL